MSFSEKQLAAIEAHFDNHSRDACPVCEGTDWTTHPDLGAVCAQHGSGVNVYKTLQVVSQVCDSCGFVDMYDAEKIGVDLDIKLKTNK